jgi:hypothetical protein
MHLRRALLLFAIVLGLAAVAASVSRSPDERGEPVSPAPGATDRAPGATASPGREVSTGTTELTFPAGEPITRRLSAGGSATIVVEADEPGQARIPDLGLSAPADPLTPARFEIFASDPGRHAISFLPTAGAEERKAGTLVIAPAPG